jgi:3-oxoacid CoA-transferase B subunit
MEHNTKDGGAKIMKECTLPLTGKRVVDMIITELGVFAIDERGLRLTQLAEGISVDEVKARTEADLHITLTK